MKTCPKCQTENQNHKSYCIKCYLDISTVIPDISPNYVMLMIKRIQEGIDKKIKKRVIFFISYICFFCIISLILSHKFFGEIGRVAILIPFFIPAIILILFPYDKVYYNYNLKKKNIKKHISDFYLFGFRTVGCVSLILIYMKILDIVIYTKLPEKIV